MEFKKDDVLIVDEKKENLFGVEPTKPQPTVEDKQSLQRLIQAYSDCA